MSQTSLIRAAVCGLVLSFVGTASADVLFSTLGPEDSNHGHRFRGYGDSGIIPVYNLGAMPFEVGAGDFDSISVTLPLTWMHIRNPESYTIDLKIYKSDGAFNFFNPDQNGPGTEIGSITFRASDIPEILDLQQEEARPVTSFEFDGVELVGNARYWLSVEPTQEQTGEIYWHENDQSHQNSLAERQRINGDPLTDWLFSPPPSTSGALRVEGVPAPGAMTLLGIGGLAAMRRRRNG